MNWIPTPQSSNIAGFSYNEDQLILTVEFKKGGTYNYYDVPHGVVEQMKVASSVGQFLTQNIKGVYRYARI